MKISLVSIAFNNYGRFVPQFLDFAKEMSPKPTEVVIVLGRNHGCTPHQIKEDYPFVKIIEYKNPPTFGKLRNIAIKHTTSEWTWFVSVDDMPMKDAIQTFKRALKKEDADYICSQWYTEGLGMKKTIHKSPTPYEYYLNKKERKKGGFIIAHSPFKRMLWQQAPYENHDYPNSPFVLDCLNNGARFIKADKPTTTYLRRPNSHARTILIKRPEKKKAVYHKRRMERGFKKYYENDK